MCTLLNDFFYHLVTFHLFFSLAIVFEEHTMRFLDDEVVPSSATAADILAALL